jgi:hypothetical protein
VVRRPRLPARPANSRIGTTAEKENRSFTHNPLLRSWPVATHARPQHPRQNCSLTFLRSLRGTHHGERGWPMASGVGAWGQRGKFISPLPSTASLLCGHTSLRAATPTATGRPGRGRRGYCTPTLRGATAVAAAPPRSSRWPHRPTPRRTRDARLDAATASSAPRHAWFKVPLEGRISGRRFSLSLLIGQTKS